METAVAAIGALGLALFAGSFLVPRLSLREQIRGLAALLVLGHVGARAYAHFNPPTAAEKFERQFGPPTPAPLFGARFVSYDASGIADLVIKPEHESGGLMIYGLGEDAIALGKWMARHPSRVPPGDVAIIARVTLIDRYGATSDQDVLTLRWPREDWLKVQWATISPGLVVELSDVVLAWPAVRSNLAEWCVAHPRWRACSRLTSEANDASR